MAHQIEVVVDGTGMFARLADKGLWDSTHMKLVGLPASSSRPYPSVGVLAELPNKQTIYIEAKLEMLMTAVSELHLHYSLTADQVLYSVTADLLHTHNSRQFPVQFTMSVAARDPVNAASTATSVIRGAGFEGTIVNIRCKRVSTPKEG